MAAPYFEIWMNVYRDPRKRCPPDEPHKPVIKDGEVRCEGCGRVPGLKLMRWFRHSVVTHG